MQLDPLAVMRVCRGESCDCVPDEVFDAVYDTVDRLPPGEDQSNRRDTRAEMLAPRMVEETGDSAPCFSLLRTGQHARIFDLVHTNLANRIANRIALERAA